jgi:hypothetical protein
LIGKRAFDASCAVGTDGEVVGLTGRQAGNGGRSVIADIEMLRVSAAGDAIGNMVTVDSSARAGVPREHHGVGSQTGMKREKGGAQSDGDGEEGFPEHTGIMVSIEPSSRHADLLQNASYLGCEAMTARSDHEASSALEPPVPVRAPFFQLYWLALVIALAILGASSRGVEQPGSSSGS